MPCQVVQALFILLGTPSPCVLASMKKPGHTVNDESLSSYVQWYDYLSQTVDADTIASLSAGACEKPVQAGSHPLHAPGNLATKSHWEDHAPLSPGSSVVVVTQAEYDGTVACSFVSESAEKSVFCAQEVAEHTLVKRWIPRDATVLEMGARYGTTSCAISQALRNSGKQVLSSQMSEFGTPFHKIGRPTTVTSFFTGGFLAGVATS